MAKDLYSLVTTILGPRIKIEYEPSVKYGIKKETLIELCKRYKGNKHPIMYHLKLSRFKLNNLLKHYKINISQLPLPKGRGLRKVANYLSKTKRLYWPACN